MKSQVVTGRSDIHGTGVFASMRIPRGGVVLRIDDSRVVDDSHPLRTELGEDPEYRDWLPDGTVVLMPSPERYINHSCTPNVFVYSVDRIRFVLAMQDIPEGEEITYDYAVNAVDGDVWTCRCGSVACRGRHRCAFFELPQSIQLEYLPFLDPWFADIHAEKIMALLRREIDYIE